MKIPSHFEEWREVPSKPGLKASSLGRICLPESTYAMPNGGTVKRKPKPRFGLKPPHENRLVVSTRKFGTIKVHQAVCEAFNGPKPFPDAVVMHLDEDYSNNTPANLAWGTQKENLNAPGFSAYCKSRTGACNPYIKGRERIESSVS